MKNILIVISKIILLIFPSVAMAALCGPEIAEKVPINDSKWVIVTKVYRCSVMDPGRMEIDAVRSDDGKSVGIAAFNEETESTVSVIGSGIFIRVPNLVDMEKKIDYFGSMKINIVYLPYDDPKERENYRFWLRHPDKVSAKKWYSEKFEGKIK